MGSRIEIGPPFGGLNLELGNTLFTFNPRVSVFHLWPSFCIIVAQVVRRNWNRSLKWLELGIRREIRPPTYVSLEMAHEQA